MLKRIDVDISIKSLIAAIDAMERVWAVAGNFLESYEVNFAENQLAPAIVDERLSALPSEIYVDGETRLFLTAVQFPEVAEYLRSMVRRVIQHNQKVGKYKVIFVDDQRPFASHAAWALALHNKADISLYIAFLKTLDMEHEVEEFQLIEQLLSAHGWCAETVDLAAVRIMTCCGQHGIDQIAEHFRGKQDTPIYLKLLQAAKVDGKAWHFADDCMKWFVEAVGAASEDNA